MFQRLACLLLAATLVACVGPRTRVDSLEPLNRVSHGLEDLGPNQISAGLDASADAVLPDVVRLGFGNFFRNLATPKPFVANLLQGRPVDAAVDLTRLAVNSSAGVGGFVDVAQWLGLDPHDEDFGQVICTWGIPFGPYVYFPVLGPSSAGEATTVTLDLAFAPADILLPQLAIHSSRPQQLRAIARARERDAPDADPYVYLRTAYRRDRLRQVRDEPAFVPPSAEEVAASASYGTCGYTRPPAPPGA
ncbi:MAG: MlaA family lipoprotein [Myxococcota bacterium]